MLLFLLSYIGGVLTILSPCILPVIPFVFAKADQPFRKSGLPLLLGMAITFAGFSSLAVLGGAWVAQANNWGRWIAIFLMTIFGLTLVFPQFFERIFEPLTRLGSKISNSSGSSAKQSSFSHSMLLGAATGLLWAPCAGPILGLILTGAATQGTPEKAVWFLFAYALGAATSLMLALVAGGKFLGTLKKSLKAERAVKTTLGIAVLLGVAAISFNLDRTVLTRISRLQTEDLESHLIDLFKPSSGIVAAGTKEDPMLALSPNLAGATKWLNSPALTLESLKGKVVVVDFWTYSCINCLRTLPYVKAWAEKYKDQGLVVIGVHTPEFAFEKDPENVAKALTDLGITYPVAMDNNYSIWNTFENRYWPAHYFFDRNGKIRHHHFGEGGYAKSEQVIQELLHEGTGQKMNTSDLVTSQVQGEGALAASKFSDVKSPETYIGYARAKNLHIDPAVKADSPVKYKNITPLKLNEWSMSGSWNIGKEKAVAVKSKGRIIYRFHARDLHLVLGPQTPGTAISFRVTLDGKAPGKDHGVDINEKGEGIVNENRLYQLIRQRSETEKLEDRTFEIEFLSPGVEVFAFTFG
ncbi:cytochrome c biogenesis protein DipZ [Bdellovibrio svalbardensis]|uniref:Cytochrome c biogenesis protein DipZ n=1 Tax=Bdellovibrio svalbardensis TaxID=2972972 RepID=A0ABT6DHK9_9BACT|nr:cytochrome c biogenesis protein DipZ [Bdellovibrio svalbardensis]MDG0815994.1 cytochrome c biogenesis protein DipZ [Bdellovibrio svalbardensis]